MFRRGAFLIVKVSSPAVKNLPFDSTNLPNAITLNAKTIFQVPLKKNLQQHESQGEKEATHAEIPPPENFNEADFEIDKHFTFSQPPLILIVEDNQEMRFYLKQILGSQVEIAEVTNGREALLWLKTQTPDLIVSDVMMPQMDGYQFLSNLKSDERLKSIPVIMVTSRSSEEDKLHGLSLGVDDYIIKPFNAKELKIRIYNLLSNLKMRQQWQTKPLEKEEETAEQLQGSAFIEKVRKFVEEHLKHAALGIGDLADYMAMSERQLYRKCGELTGMTPAQLIKEIRLKIAYKMLLSKDVTKITELSSRVGFENSAYFSRQFFERYGKKPVEFL